MKRVIWEVSGNHGQDDEWVEIVVCDDCILAIKTATALNSWDVRRGLKIKGLLAIEPDLNIRAAPECG